MISLLEFTCSSMQQMLTKLLSGAWFCFRSWGACECACSVSHVWLFATPWTIGCQAPLSVGFFPARTLGWVAISYSRDIFLIQGLNPHLLCLLHWQADSLLLYHQHKWTHVDKRLCPCGRHRLCKGDRQQRKEDMLAALLPRLCLLISVSLRP